MKISHVAPRETNTGGLAFNKPPLTEKCWKADRMLKNAMQLKYATVNTLYTPKINFSELQTLLHQVGCTGIKAEKQNFKCCGGREILFKGVVIQAVVSRLSWVME